MPDEGRRPAVVMFTDMVGYSELTQQSETEALRLLNEHRRIVRPLLATHGGREVKTIGDAFMVEFPDGLSATRCALEIQRQHAERNRDLELKEIQIRIGLHGGEVIYQEGDLFGDTVNVASRIEPLAPPGGICLSEPVYEAVRERLDVTVSPIGPATLKNIHLPIAVYRIDLRPERQVPTREGPWVDRERELAGLTRGLEAALEGRGSVVLVGGEAGVGKTRLAEQAIRAAARRGIRAVRGRASEAGTDAPYAIWVDALRGLAAELSPEVLRRAAGDYSADVEPLLPPPTAGMNPPAPTAAADPEAAQGRLFAGVARLFREIGQEEPVVLLFDDLQWADAGSLRLLDAFAKELGGARVFVLATYRQDAGSTPATWKEVVASVGSGPVGTHLVVPRLDLPAVRQLVLLLVKSKAIPDSFVLQIHGKTRGNPFFIEEVIRSLRGQGILPGDTDQPFARLPETLPLPDSVRRLVRERIEEVDPPVIEFLRAVAVLGPEFSLAPLERLTGLTRDALLDRLGRTIALGILTERSDERGTVRYSFSDLETWETIYGDLPASLRVRLHRRAGEALEQLGTEGTAVPPAELAHHFREGHEPPRALEYAFRAAEEAARLYAREEAVRHYRVCLELLDAHPDERRRLQVMVGLSDQLHYLGQTAASQSMRGEAAARYETLGELRSAGNLHRKIAHSMRDDADAARHHWEEALRLLEDGPETPELARLYSTIAGLRYEAGEAGPSRELITRAAEVARRVSDTVTQVSAQMMLAALLPLGERSRVFRELEEALRLAKDAELMDFVSNLYMLLAFAHLHLNGDRAEAERAATEMVSAARRSRDLLMERWFEGNFFPYIAWRLGEYDRALRQVEAHARYAEGDPRKLVPVAFLVGADIELTRGNTDQARQWIEEADALLQVGGDWSDRVLLRNLQGRVDLLRGRFPRARGALHEAHGLATGMGAPALSAVYHAETLHLEVETELGAGDRRAAEQHLAELVALAESGGSYPLLGHAARATGLVRQATGDLAASAEAFHRSVEVWERIDWAYELARTRLLLAGVYRRLDRPDQAQATEESARRYLERIGSPAGRAPAPSG